MTSTISDEQVRDTLRAFNEVLVEDIRVTGLAGLLAIREAIDAYERTRAPDPRVVELIQASRALLASAATYMTHRNAKERETYRAIRVALATMENGNG